MMLYEYDAQLHDQEQTGNIACNDFSATHFPLLTSVQSIGWLIYLILFIKMEIEIGPQLSLMAKVHTRAILCMRSLSLAINIASLVTMRIVELDR